METALAAARSPKRYEDAERFLTPEDIGRIVQRPPRWVRKTLLKTGIIRSVPTGRKNLRVTPEDWEAWKAKGCPTTRPGEKTKGKRG